MLKQNTILFAILLIGIASFSQNSFTVSKLLENESLKEGWIKNSQDKFEILKTETNSPNKKELVEYYKTRFEAVKKLITSNEVIANNEVTEYLNSLVKQIYSTNKVLLGTERVIIMSNAMEANAYTFGEGTLVFNAGLYVQLKNEAEVVFVICHELAHDFLKHGNTQIETVVEKLNSKEFKDELKRISKLEFNKRKEAIALEKGEVLSIKKHSRAKETEADKFAFDCMKNMGLDLSSIKSTLLFLEKSTSLFDNVNLQLPKIFNYPEFPFDNNWLKVESSIFSDIDKKAEEDKIKKLNDSLSSHPNCKKRILDIEPLIASLKLKSQKQFLTNEAIFKALQKKLSFQLFNSLSENKKFEELLYHGLKMVTNEQNNEYCYFLVLNGLNGLYTAQKEHTIGKSLRVENDYFNEQQNLLIRLLNNVTLEELGKIAYYFSKKIPSLIGKNSLILNEINIANKNFSNN